MKDAAIFLFALTVAASAQTPPDALPSVRETMKQNAEALKQYTHKRRTTIEVKGQSRGARVDLVRYVDGRMETVPLESPAPRGGGRGGRGGPLRGIIVQKKKEEMKEDVERLTGLLRRYFSPDSDSPHALLEKATISRTGPEADAAIQVVAKGVVEPSDSLTVIWSVANHRPEKIEIHTQLDGKPVSAAVEYASLAGGPFYAARTTISAPKKEIGITIETFDYVRDGALR